MVDQQIIKYNAELEQVLINQSPARNRMQEMREFYKHSVFYKSKSGDTSRRTDLKANMIRTFADKNIQYTSSLPIFKVPTTGADEASRASASVREKIIYATHSVNNTPLKQKKWAFDATVFGAAVAETYFDLSPGGKREVTINRYDPRYCFWQYSNDSEPRVIAFWAVFPITKAECLKRYGKTPSASLLNVTHVGYEPLERIDGQEWYLMVKRWDEEKRAVWVGDVWIEKPHNHMAGCMPIDVVEPIWDGDFEQNGGMYLEPLLPLQAELNETIRQRANIVRRFANPVIWGRGIVNRQFEETKRALQKPAGGFVGLKQGGELGALQVNDTTMLQEHKNDILADMMRVSGYGSAAFGEAGGANSSGDALAMVFNPTQRLIDYHNISWMAFYESINSKILRLYYRFLKTGETKSLSGFAPGGTLLGLSRDSSDDSQKDLPRSFGGFNISFDKTAIDGNYFNIALPRPVTPRDELANRRLLVDEVQAGLISHVTAYEERGILSPEDELALLKSEKQDPILNPDLAKLAPLAQLGDVNNGGVGDAGRTDRGGSNNSQHSKSGK